MPDIARLAALQKRIKDWTGFLEHEVADPSLKAAISEHLSKLKQELVVWWEQNTLSHEAELLIEDLERKLELFFEEARVHGGSRGSGYAARGSR